MDALYDKTLRNMDRTLFTLAKSIPAPEWVAIGDGYAYRYKEKGLRQAIVQKVARYVSGLHAARLLLESGFIQEQGSLQRMLDEFEQDVLFLSHAVVSNDVTDLHKRFLDAFYMEEFSDQNNPKTSSQKRPSIPRDKIQAYLSRIEVPGCNPSDTQKATRVIGKTYSGYVHGASPHIMEMFYGNPPRFHVSGLVDSPLYQDHEDDLWNYFYRGICLFGVVANAFGSPSLFYSINEYQKQFAKKAGKNYD